MHTSQKLANLQQSLIQKYSQEATSLSFFNQLTDSNLLDVVEGLLPKHRERRFPPTETLSMFLAQAMQADRSCQNIINEATLNRALCGLSPGSSNTGSYCKARRRLPLSMVSTLARHTGMHMASNAPASWNGRPVRLIDGTTVELPDTEENRQAYQQTRNGRGCPLSRIVGIICLASGAILNAAIGPFTGKGSGEQSLLRGMLDTFKEGDLVLGDAYYGTYFLLAELIARDLDAVFEQYGARKRTINFRKGKQLGKKDHLRVYEKPKAKPSWMSQEDYDLAPETLTIRELEVGHKIIVTTLLSPKAAPKKALENLYKQRWHVELDLRNIKTTLGMETLSCKTPDMIEKEIWIYLLAHNLLRMAMVEAASVSALLPRQLSFKHCLQLWRAWRQSIQPSDHQSLQILLLLMAQNQVGQRPGRVEPRAVKRWRKSFPLLTKPRQEMREIIKKSGHPTKAKMVA